MAKKRIFINLHYLELGGAEKALLGLLEAIDKNRYEVDLFLNQHTGAFMPLIPAGINLLPEIPAYAALERPISYSIRHRLWGSVLRRAYRKWKFNRYLKKNNGCSAGASHIYMNTEISYLPDLHYLGEYDMAVSFLDPPHIVQDKVLAKKKIEWIHTDFASVKYDSELTFDRWSRNDYIISISEDVTRSFLSLFPELSPKLRLIENIISPAFVRHQAEEETADHESRQVDFKFCSIGRLNAEAKNFKSIPEIASLLKSMGLKFTWQIIGPGDPAFLLELIDKHAVGDEVQLLGARNNPYPYIAACDIYVQPSLYEGKSIAVREAQILCKPVLITDYPTSQSQVTNGVDGIICRNDNKMIANAIYDLATDVRKREEIAMYLSRHDYGMMSEVEKLYALI